MTNAPQIVIDTINADCKKLHDAAFANGLTLAQRNAILDRAEKTASAIEATKKPGSEWAANSIRGEVMVLRTLVLFAGN